MTECEHDNVVDCEHGEAIPSQFVSVGIHQALPIAVHMRFLFFLSSCWDTCVNVRKMSVLTRYREASTQSGGANSVPEVTDLFADLCSPLHSFWTRGLSLSKYFSSFFHSTCWLSQTDHVNGALYFTTHPPSEIHVTKSKKIPT